MSEYCKCLNMQVTSCSTNTNCEHRTKETNTNQNTKRMI